MKQLLPTLAVCAAIVVAAPAMAQNAEEQARLQQVSERGRLLYELDQAAWVTTDDMLARVPGAEQWPIKGWVVEREGTGGYAVTYYGQTEQGPVGYYLGHVKDGKAVSGEALPTRPPLSPSQLRLVRARDAVARLDAKPCTNARFNLAMIPPAEGDKAIDVYLLTAQTETGIIPFGGHHLVRVADDGTIVSRRAFTNSCLNMPANPPEGGTAVGVVVTHLLDPIPTEIHVFMSLTAGMKVFVGTDGGKRLWMVDGARIQPVEQKGKARPVA
jgi:hypothetical protein